MFIKIRHILFVMMLAATLSVSAQEWQQQRVDASSNPDVWIKKTSDLIEQYDNQRQFHELAMAYALQAEAYRYSGNESKAQEAITEGLRFAELADSDIAKTLLRMSQTWYSLQRGQLRQANTSVIYAIENAKASGNKDLQIEAEILHAQVMQNMGDIARALQILEQLNRNAYSARPRLQMEFHALIGSIYLDVGANEIALEHIKDALEISRQHLGEWDVSVLEYNLARTYQALGNARKAETHFKSALEISQAIGDDLGVAYALYQMASIDLAEQDYRQALSRLNQALPQFRSAGAHPMEAKTRLSIVSVYLGIEAYDKAQNQLSAAASIVNTLSDAQLHQNLHESWSQYYQQVGNYQAALKHYKTSVDYMQKAQQQAQDKQLQEIMVRLEIKEQETTNELLKKENELQQLELQEQQTSYYLLIWIIISGFLVVIIVSAFLYQQWRARKNFAELALKDDLTNAPNRRAIVRICKKGLEQAREQQRQLALAVLDFDHFKTINDQFGHDVGDHVLQRFAEVAKQSLRNQDSFGRLGGEEWLLVFFDVTKEDAKNIFERITEKLNSQPIDGLPEGYRITFSMGFTNANPEDNFDSLYKRADNVLFEAKDKGRERLIITD
ncbi:tetratricopeptide repeat-containing diguanylate cyclase [Idiomarina sp. HP20-50]|uniref:tetratricopeptide repeat-containing diguanylate cyclase n=1 Tax=Idiomarina sp. HP20-50 TaxID=3070813 RepID=UPI00294AB1F1|nr:tetratricopeptide repeat-containing diguanylate cyclase [Idiomarina sp. HP20-50]MDV6317072.1 tetratricopeptide repeat-containing diguanylate cyclase [Idiomarina sp. HP20-50]